MVMFGSMQKSISIKIKYLFFDVGSTDGVDILLDVVV